MTARAETLIVGAGPAGLAVGACLRRAGHDAIILERRDAVGSSWRNHYERLHLHTTRRNSALPYHPLPRDWPRYPSRAQVVEYLDSYARTFDLAPRLNETVTAAKREGPDWLVTSTGGSYRANNLVIASGYNAAPYRPDFPGSFSGELLHSADYKSGAAFRGRRVLVVGAGNTGAEIALDLCESGATVELCVRGALHVVKRDIFGIPAQALAIATAWIPMRALDVLFGWLVWLTVGNLTRYGLTQPREGIVAQIERLGRIPLIDIGTVERIKRGDITVRPQIATFTQAGATFTDGTSHAYDAVVLATGYRPQLDFIAGAALDDRGYPRTDQPPGLYFVGFHNAVTGLLREIAREALRVSRAISAGTG